MPKLVTDSNRQCHQDGRIDDLSLAPSETALKIGQLDFACVDLFEQVAKRFFGVIEYTDRVQTSVYFPKEVYAALVKWAEEEDRVSNLVVRLCPMRIKLDFRSKRLAIRLWQVELFAARLFFSSVKSRFDFASLGASLKNEGFKMDKVELSSTLIF